MLIINEGNNFVANYNIEKNKFKILLKSNYSFPRYNWKDLKFYDEYQKIRLLLDYIPSLRYYIRQNNSLMNYLQEQKEDMLPEMYNEMIEYDIKLYNNSGDYISKTYINYLLMFYAYYSHWIHNDSSYEIFNYLLAYYDGLEDIQWDDCDNKDIKSGNKLGLKNHKGYKETIVLMNNVLEYLNINNN